MISVDFDQPQLDTRYSQWLTERAVNATIPEALREFEAAIITGEIAVPAATVIPAPNKAGGVNFCPNSDLKFSTRAATVPGALPTDTEDDNFECYRFYRQEKDAVIVLDAAHALKAAGHSLFAASEGANAGIPIWNKSAGQLEFGAAAAPLYDVAIHLYANDVKPNDNTWYVRFSLGALTADAVPEDLEMYCGFRHKTAAGESWITGGNFTLNYTIIGVKGARTIKYRVIALNDAGSVLVSQLLTITDAPNIIDQQNFPRISYGSAVSSGFVQFEIYRETDGQAFKIADIRNTNRITFDDDRRNPNDEVPVIELPDAASSDLIAFAQSTSLDVGASGAAFLVNDFAIKIPNDYNSSETLDKSQFVRFGFTRTSAVNRQIRLDRILCSPSYNIWSESPFDPQGVTPTSAPETGTPSTGDTPAPEPPPAGGGGYVYECVWIDTPVLRFDYERAHEWIKFKDIRRGDIIESGETQPNCATRKRVKEETECLIIFFANGSYLPCTPRHRIFINDYDTRGATAESLKIGARVWGWNSGAPGFTTVTNKIRVKLKQAEKFGTFIGLRGANKRYVAGFSKDNNSGVFSSNRKYDYERNPDLLLLQ